MISLLYLSFSAATICVVVLVLLKYISISKMKLDGGKDPKVTMPRSTLEVLTLLKTLKPFPISIHKGWKLHSHRSCGRVWMRDIGGDNTLDNHGVFAAFKKIKVPPQVVNQLLKDVTKTSSWKPGCLATSITFQAPDYDGASRLRGIMGSYPVQHDIVIEETSPVEEKKEGFGQSIKSLFDQSSSPHTVTKEFKRYWHREDNGVCWHLQMCEEHQQWLFFLSQPVEEVDRCLLSILGYQGTSSPHSGAHFVSEVMGSFTEYIQYRRLPMTPLIDIKLPAKRPDRIEHSYSSSDDTLHQSSRGNRMFSRFRSLVEKPALEAEKFLTLKRKLDRSASILHHMSSSVADDKRGQGNLMQQLKTSSLDRKDMPQLQQVKQEDMRGIGRESDLDDKHLEESDNVSRSSVDVEVSENNNLKKTDAVEPGDPKTGVSGSTESGRRDVSEESADHPSALEKDIDKILEEDVNDQEKYEKIGDALLNSSDSKVDIHHIVMANHAAAELLAVALQASNIDLSKSIEQQVMRSGGWMFCGLENDVVVLKKISLKENIQCFLGKGVIQAAPKTVFNAIKNPRTRFTYDDTLKKVDVLETVSDTIKVVYYYHEMLQLFKTESFDMILTQNERADRGDKYVLALQSVDRAEPTLSEGTLRVKVLPSGWIIEPLPKDRKMVSMVTYIMQVDFGDTKRGVDRTPYEELIAKQPMCIAFLRQYLRGYSHLK